MAVLRCFYDLFHFKQVGSRHSSSVRIWIEMLESKTFQMKHKKWIQKSKIIWGYPVSILFGYCNWKLLYWIATWLVYQIMQPVDSDKRTKARGKTKKSQPGNNMISANLRQFSQIRSGKIRFRHKSEAGVELSQVSLVGVIYKAWDRQQLTNRVRKRVSGCGPSVMCQHNPSNPHPTPVHSLSKH